MDHPVTTVPSLHNKGDIKLLADNMPLIGEEEEEEDDIVHINLDTLFLDDEFEDVLIDIDTITDEEEEEADFDFNFNTAFSEDEADFDIIDFDEYEDDIFDVNDFDVEIRFEPAKKESLQGLGKETTKEVTKCSVCLDEVAVGSEMTRLPCSHCYHENCIFQWLERSKFCPLCRFELP